MISSIFALCPYRFTTITAFGNFPCFSASCKARSNACGDIFHVSISESMRTGVAPWYRIGFALATNVSDEQNTVSTGPTSRKLNHRSIAAVHEETTDAPLTLL